MIQGTSQGVECRYGRQAGLTDGGAWAGAWARAAAARKLDRNGSWPKGVPMALGSWMQIARLSLYVSCMVPPAGAGVSVISALLHPKGNPGAAQPIRQCAHVRGLPFLNLMSACSFGQLDAGLTSLPYHPYCENTH